MSRWKSTVHAMRVVGIAVKLETEGRPTARGVLVEDNGSGPVIVDQFALPGDDVDFARQLFELSQATSSRLSALEPDRVAVCRADFPPAGSRKDGPKLRLLAEGAITAAAYHVVPNTYLVTGHDIGTWNGCGKDAVKDKAKALVQADRLPLKWVDATFAALGALVHP